MFNNQYQFFSFFPSVFVLLILIVAIYVYKQFIYSLRRQKSLKGKVVLVTGAGHGLGREICLALARESCHLICVALHPEGNLETKQQVKQINNECQVLTIECDVSKRKLVKEMATKIYQQFPNVDILINNAGVLFASRLLDSTDDNIQRVIDVNLLSHFWTIREFLPKMLEQNAGLIVAINSVAGELGFDSAISYCASKFGVRGLMESLTRELIAMKTNIKTLSVYPGIISTTMVPKKLQNPGFLCSDATLLYILNAKDVANDIVDAIKLKKRRMYAPYIYGFLIPILNVLIPNFILDFIHTKLLKVNALYVH